MTKKDAFVIVTGAEGFIGRALVERLAARHPVVGLDRELHGKHPDGVLAADVDLTSDESLRSGLDLLREALEGMVTPRIAARHCAPRHRRPKGACSQLSISSG